MDKDYFKKLRILDGGMGQDLLERGLVTKGTLWSSSALLEEKNHKLIIDSHLSFINAGAEVICTNSFTSRRIRFVQNKVNEHFEYANKKAGELALEAKKISKKNILVAGSLPAQNDTYCVDKRDQNIIKKNFYDQANLIAPYIDFFYLDVLSSGKEIEIALNVIEKFNKPVLVGLHLKKNCKLPSGETITEIVEKFNNNNWLGVISACVSPEIVDESANEFKSLNIPFGFKVNLWGVEEPLPVDEFNTAKPDEIGTNPNIRLGTRKDITDEIFKNFVGKIIKKGATILGGCCEVKTNHIKQIKKLIN